MNSVESRIVHTLDKLDGLFESMHDSYAGKHHFLGDVCNEAPPVLTGLQLVAEVEKEG